MLSIFVSQKKKRAARCHFGNTFMKFLQLLYEGYVKDGTKILFFKEATKDVQG